MAPLARLTVALVLTVFATPVSAHPALPVRGEASLVRPLQIHVQLGRQAGAPQPVTFKLGSTTARKAGPSPAPSPEFNPLKRRRIAMPALDPETQLAF